MDQRLADYIARLPSKPGREPDALAGTESPDVPFRGQLRSAGLIWRFGALLGAHAVKTGLLLAGWSFIGAGALSGRLDQGWLTAWALCLASTLPLQLMTDWLEGVIAIGFGGLLKQRLLAGAMSMDADLMRRKGVGELLGEVLEAEAIERLGTGGGLKIVLAAMELTLLPFVFAWGAAASLEVVLLVAWVALALLLIARNTRRRAEWTRMRLALTHKLVEKMVAHRTRLAQQSPAEWHLEEDPANEQYAAASQTLDRSTAALESALPVGYVITALAALAPSFLAGRATLAQQAITLGGLLFASTSLEKLTAGFTRAAAAWIAWQRVKLMFGAAEATAQGVAAGAPMPSGKALQARHVCFTHQGRVEAALKGCTLEVERGDRILLEGCSGSGKSTFASLLAGCRRPSSGLILAGGLDLQTLGDVHWRRRVAAAPQYHENHILSAPLGFNLLLARPYPHSAEDFEEARDVCRELGLGPLLERMPAGLDQMVGETGWQLSQGERSRVFLARALLQNADLVLLDESLAALDPENLRQCLDCVIRRAPTLLVIAHP